MTLGTWGEAMTHEEFKVAAEALALSQGWTVSVETNGSPVAATEA